MNKTETLDAVLFFLASVTAALSVFIQLGWIDSSNFVLNSLLLAICLISAGWYAYRKLVVERKDKENAMTSVLDFVTTSLIENGKSSAIRANIMMPAGLCRRSLRIRFCSTNMKHDEDRDIALEKWLGCAGIAWGINKSLAANLAVTNSGKGMPAWILPLELAEKTKAVKKVVSVPLHNPKSPSKVAAVLNVDSKDADADFILDVENLESFKATYLLIEEMLDNLHIL